MKLPWYVFWIALLFCFPTIIGCTTPPKMPPAQPEGKLVAEFDFPNTDGDLLDGPCLDLKVMEFLRDKLPVEVLATVKAGSGTYDEKPYGLCWFWVGDEAAAVVVWEDTGHFVVPRPLLKFPLGI